MQLAGARDTTVAAQIGMGGQRSHQVTWHMNGMQAYLEVALSNQEGTIASLATCSM